MQNVRTAKFHRCLISRQQYHRRLGHSSSSFTFRFLQWTPANFFKKSCFIDFKFIQHLKPTENKFPLWLPLPAGPVSLLPFPTALVSTGRCPFTVPCGHADLYKLRVWGNPAWGMPIDASYPISFSHPMCLHHNLAILPIFHILLLLWYLFSSVQLLSHVWLFVTPWTAAR